MNFWDGFILFVIFVPLLVIWGVTAYDIFARPDISGWAKAGWFVLIFLLPLLGVLIYLVARPSAVTLEQKRAEQAARTAYFESIASDEITRLSVLHEEGKLSDTEYVTAKTAVLSRLQQIQPQLGTKAPELKH